MSGRTFSVIFLPTAECNVACEYCFEVKEPHRLSLDTLPAMTKSILDHMDQEDFEECEIYWQGGEAMIMGPAWYVKAKELMEQAAEDRGRKFIHYLQTNLISYSSEWNDVIFDMFNGSLGTSMDFPNLHRKTFSGSAEKYTETWRARLDEARSANIQVGVIAVLHQGSLDVGAEAFYRYYVDELGIDDFQVNTPFPGGPANEAEIEFQLETAELSHFLGELFDVWMKEGFDDGVALGPFDALINHFSGKPARLPCIWKENCSNQFISVDSKGTVAQCDCWVTSYPDHYFGNMFSEPDLSRMLSESPARKEFVERPGKLVEEEDCLSCRFLSICHGGCPVRTFTALGTMNAKDPYCEVYKTVFARAENYGGELRKKAASPTLEHA